MLKLSSAAFAWPILAAAPASSTLLMTATVAPSFSAASNKLTVSCSDSKLNRSGIVGLITPDSGRILLDEQDITNLPMYQRARRGISYLPQEASIFRKLTVEENLMAILETLPLRARERRENRDRLLEHELTARPERDPAVRRA